jgi:hypothetical protein
LIGLTLGDTINNIFTLMAVNWLTLRLLNGSNSNSLRESKKIQAEVSSWIEKEKRTWPLGSGKLGGNLELLRALNVSSSSVAQHIK